MAHKTAIPQEIIDEIIAHLTDDLPTLHCCSSTSYSLYVSSRKHIFSTICLYNTSATQNLLSLLDQNPGVANFVRTLHVYTSPRENTTTLPAVLARLSFVRNLIIGREGESGSMNWYAIPHATKHALEQLITSPALHTLVFTSVIYLPISILSLAAHIKALKLYRVAFTEPEPPDHTDVPHHATQAPTPIGLESIHCSSSMSNLSCPPLHAPHLRHYTIVGNSMANLLTVQKICTATTPACAIDDLTWLEYRGDDQYINPEVLVCPHRLTFSTWTFDAVWIQRLPAMWASISKLLSSTSLVALEEFSVTLKCASDLPVLPNVNGSDGDRDIKSACLGAPRVWWNQIDARLGDPSHAPRLRAVNIGLQIIGNGTDDSNVDGGTFEMQVMEYLPLLRSRGPGVLSARLEGET
ncbi:hypothetical protein BDZ94DRAFT_1324664 [Collybia nuda]|uniref:Uncharacterized protein n=1 Tax=Collybia nuda TaxID=64659 RepID=A0A9P5XXK4_9AGAR|nr:hypothetical protein BDZ94DRAFT_1324664 [Collybia nuda]